jgi:hypothetical protein
VDARWQGSRELYPAVVTQVRSDRHYSIFYFDGAYDDSVPVVDLEQVTTVKEEHKTAATKVKEWMSSVIGNLTKSNVPPPVAPANPPAAPPAPATINPTPVIAPAAPAIVNPPAVPAAPVIVNPPVAPAAPAAAQKKLPPQPPLRRDVAAGVPALEAMMLKADQRMNKYEDVIAEMKNQHSNNLAIAMDNMRGRLENVESAHLQASKIMNGTIEAITKTSDLNTADLQKKVSELLASLAQEKDETRRMAERVRALEMAQEQHAKDIAANKEAIAEFKEWGLVEGMRAHPVLLQ